MERHHRVCIVQNRLRRREPVARSVFECVFCGIASEQNARSPTNLRR